MRTRLLMDRLDENFAGIKVGNVIDELRQEFTPADSRVHRMVGG